MAFSGRNRLRLALVVLLGAAGAVGLLLTLDYFAGDLADNLWGPAYYLVRGWSPYRSQEMLRANAPLWFPPAIGLFFPLGWLDRRTAANLWLLGCLGLVGLLLHRYRAANTPLAWAAVLAMLFPPLLIHLWLGQYSLLVAALSVAAAGLVARGRYALAGLALAPALGKPQLLLLALPGLWLAAWRGGKWRGGALFPAAVLGGALLLTVPLWIAYPGWFPDFWQAQQGNPSWLQPTLYTLLGMVGGPAGRLLAGAVSLGLFGLNLGLWWRRPPEEALPWSLALTTVASPYLWTWDMVLLLPLVLRSGQRQAGRPARLLWGCGYLLCWGLLLGIHLLTGEQNDRWHFWVPWLFIGLALLSPSRPRAETATPRPGSPPFSIPPAADER